MTFGGTYRIQFNRDFDFEDASEIVDYLSTLGVTHLYSSPILGATPGSSHGYDVVDPTVINPELGGREGLDVLVGALDTAGLGQIMDIVPNHMAAHPSNPWWWDVLRRGPTSPFASFFDIKWGEGDSRSDFTVLVPILADHYGRVLDDGEIELDLDDEEIVVTYGDHRLPVSQTSTESLVEATGPEGLEAELKKINEEPDRLDAILTEQSYRLAHWRTANEELDYRRFFNIETLIGVKVESENVFQETHALIIGLVAEGVIDGLRIDHVDGLRDPERYLSRLSDATGSIYTVVEKILEPGEELPPAWPIAGTTGYDFLNRVNDSYIEPESESAFSNLYRAFTGESADYADVVHAAKWQIMDTQLTTELQRLTRLLGETCRHDRRHRDHTHRDLRETLGEVVANFGVYRTYVRPGTPPSQADRAHVRAAAEGALERRPDLDAELVGLIEGIALGEGATGTETELCERLQQFTGPVMAKGVEDTAFYRYNRFVSLNEVGGDPAEFGSDPSRFHQHMGQSATEWPHTMLTLSTHDTKRSADVRARLNVLSEIPVDWRAAVEAWAAHNERHREGPSPDRNAEYLLYQTLVGAWPIEIDRVLTFMEKATREAKTHTSWLEPNGEYDQAIEGFTQSILTDAEFVSQVELFLEEHRVIQRGRRNSLSQQVLLLTCPGVPDIYQGTETWDLSLVDPDNRQLVDYEQRRNLLNLVRNTDWAAAARSPASLKLWLTQRLLNHRRENQEVYDTSTYEALKITGPSSPDVLGFRRSRLAVLARTRTTADRLEFHADLPPGRWTDVLTGSTHRGGSISAREILGDRPASVLARDS